MPDLGAAVHATMPMTTQRPSLQRVQQPLDELLAGQGNAAFAAGKLETIGRWPVSNAVAASR